jgi:hypothetical protein
MFDFTRHFRGLGIAVAVLALSAGAVFAGQAALSAPVTSPVAAEETPDADETPGTEAPDTEEPTEDADEDAPEGAADGEDGSHGTLVSEAAQMETPAGFENHGAFVSCVAKLNNGQWAGAEPAEPVVLAELTPEACEALAEEAAAAKAAAKDAKAAERDAAKAERAAAKDAKAAERAAAKAERAAAKAARGQ